MRWSIWLVLVVAWVSWGCGDDPGIRAAFMIEVDPEHPDISGNDLAPSMGPVTISGDAALPLRLDVRARQFTGRRDHVWVEIFIENTGAAPLADVRLEVAPRDGTGAIIDVTGDAFAEPSGELTIPVGGIGPYGVGRAAVAVPVDRPARLAVDVIWQPGSHTATSSAPLAIAHGAGEVWIPVPDADLIAVVDTASDTRVAQVPVPGPHGVAITPDDRFVLVVSPASNRVTVIERERREVVQTFEEADGIGREPRHVVLSPDGARAFVSAYVGDTITSLERIADGFEIGKSAAVGRRPTGMSVTPDGETLLVSHFLPRGPITHNHGWVSVLSTDPLEPIHEVVLDDHFNVEPTCLADVFGASGEDMTFETSPSLLAGVFLDPGGGSGWVPGTRIFGMPVWERGPDAEQLSDLVAPRPGELNSTIVFLLDTREPRAAHRAAMVADPERPEVSRSYARCTRLGTEIEMIRNAPVPGVEGELANRLAAVPTGVTGLSEAGRVRFVAFSPGGRRALLLAYSSDEIVVVDGITRHPTSVTHLPLSGSNPVGLALTADGEKAYVMYENSIFTSVLDVSAYADPGSQPPSFVPFTFRDVEGLPPAAASPSSKLLVRDVSAVPESPPIAETRQVALVDSDPVDPVRRRGRVLFNSANPVKYPGLSQSKLGSCGGCHPDGGSDGSVWATMEGERRTLSLRGGVAGRGWLHASGTHRDAEEFVTTVVSDRFGGALNEEDTAALADYLAFGIPALQPPAVDEALAAEGAVIFEARCRICHAGETASSGMPDPDNPWGGGHEDGPELYDIGTATSFAFANFGPGWDALFPAREAELIGMLRGDRALGPGDPVEEALDFRPRPERPLGMFKAPSLVGLYDQVLYYHDGRFTSLEEAVAYIDEATGIGLSEDERRAVVEYLKTL